MINIRCITMQKNETYLLKAWIKYYSYLFGIENLYILDNGSSREETKDILAFYQKLGCNVEYQYNTYDDFENKGQIICDIIKEWDVKENYDFVVPVDVDEFIILHKDYPSCNRKKIHSYFQSLIGIKNAFLMEETFLNVPGEVGFFSPTYVQKGFFAKDTIQALDVGFHHPVSKHSVICKKTALAYLHFHNRSFLELLEQSKIKLKHRVNINDKEALKNYKGRGEHLIRYLFMTEEGYYHLYRNNGHIYFYELIQLFLLLSIDLEELFNGKYIDLQPVKNKGILVRYPSLDNRRNYLFGYFNRYQYIVTNNDVQRTGIDPVLHFCLHGFKERRLINLSKSEFIVPKENFQKYISDENNLYIFNQQLKVLI